MNPAVIKNGPPSSWARRMSPITFSVITPSGYVQSSTSAASYAGDVPPTRPPGPEGRVRSETVLRFSANGSNRSCLLESEDALAPSLARWSRGACGRDVHSAHPLHDNFQLHFCVHDLVLPVQKVLHPGASGGGGGAKGGLGGFGGYSLNGQHMPL